MHEEEMERFCETLNLPLVCQREAFKLVTISDICQDGGLLSPLCKIFVLFVFPALITILPESYRGQCGNLKSTDPTVKASVGSQWGLEVLRLSAPETTPASSQPCPQ